ncbi:MAG: hypothetical protein UY76_C0042G0006 [Candidatus Uhrbacteria bacterium GW2011_GWA2_52_8d]|uniref:Uncharacterized protein n=1 Tax=Candidatus Uhrbacteria bacterium GW2011_GWA2_52_8d TaxID=1618979 RepID=A0A0G2AHQ4_9BACT|nr:MAG: hypothetical protein UY76_C0042G0006 [Candidatus Uhrbacteria bacterium GW2011_GWA2_52_8d]
MRHPVLTFVRNPSVDAQTAWQFFKNPIHGGENFWHTRALPFHESLADLEQKSDPRRILEAYIQRLYKEHAQALTAREHELEAFITRSLPLFFQQTDRLFPECPWPQQSLTVLFSVFNFCPRFLEEGAFQIFSADSNQAALFTTCHELLHFIFYHFAEETFPKLQTLDKNSGTFWLLAELFNHVIQRTPAFTAIHGEPGESTYAVLQPYAQRARELWHDDVRAWIVSMFPIVNSTHETAQNPTGV